MTTPDPYNEAVRACFENPVHAGDLDGDYARVLEADVAESRNGARIVLCAGLIDGKIAALRFRVRGCPYLIAAAEAACDSLEGKDLEQLAAISASELQERLAAPQSKTGRLLLVEDAAKALLKSNGELSPGT
jgi:NifU-like protein involved in Fe-S cluster formation